MSNAEMADLYDAGYTLREIGDKAGFCEATIWKRLRAMGVQLRRRGTRVRVVAERLERQRAWRAAGLSWRQIGKLEGHSGAAAWRFWQTHAVKQTEGPTAGPS